MDAAATTPSLMQQADHESMQEYSLAVKAQSVICHLVDTHSMHLYMLGVCSSILDISGSVLNMSGNTHLAV